MARLKEKRKMIFFIVAILYVILIYSLLFISITNRNILLYYVLAITLIIVFLYTFLAYRRFFY